MHPAPADQAVATTMGLRLRWWVAGWGPRQWWKTGLVAILAVTALFGGLDTVDTSVTEVKPGEEFSDGEFTLTIERATLVPEVRSGTSTLAAAKPGRRYLGVVATLRNDGSIPGKLTYEIDLRDQPDDEFVGVMRLADGSRILTLGPGLQEQLAFVWELPEDAVTVDDAVTLRVWRKQFKQGFAVYGELWVDTADYFQLALPVKVAP